MTLDCFVLEHLFRVVLLNGWGCDHIYRGCGSAGLLFLILILAFLFAALKAGANEESCPFRARGIMIQ